MESFQIKLSSKEILILSAMLGFKSVFGVDDVFLDKEVDIKPLIRQTVRYMERKKLIRYDLDGSLFVASKLRESIECLCNAETIGMFTTNLISGKKATVYVFGKDGQFAVLQCDADRKYIINLSKDLPLSEILSSKIITTEADDINEMILFEEAENVREQIEKFNRDGAEKQIQKHLSNISSAKAITKILSGNCGYLSVQIYKKIYKKRKAFYKVIYNTLINSIDGINVSVYTDENDLLHFESIGSEEIIKLISSNLKIETKRGDV